MFLGGVDEGRLPELARYERQTASPGAAAAILQHNVNMDVRYALGAVRCRRSSSTAPAIRSFRCGRASTSRDHIPGARDRSSFPATSTSAAIPATTTTSSTRSRSSSPARRCERTVDVDRVLMTVLFTDIVGSTAHAVAMGDQAWRTLLEQHDTARRTRSSAQRASS